MRCCLLLQRHTTSLSMDSQCFIANRWAYFGVPHVYQLQNAGHTLLASMCLYSGMSMEVVAHLETITYILQQSSTRWRCASRGLGMLRSMAAHFGIQLSNSTPQTTQAQQHWIRTLPRKKPEDQTASGSSGQADEDIVAEAAQTVQPVASTSGPVISNTDWMTRTAAGDDLPTSERMLSAHSAAPWSLEQDRDSFAWTGVAATGAMDDIPLFPSDAEQLDSAAAAPYLNALDDEESRMLFSEFGLGLSGGEEVPCTKDSLLALLESWDATNETAPEEQHRT